MIPGRSYRLDAGAVQHLVIQRGRIGVEASRTSATAAAPAVLVVQPNGVPLLVVGEARRHHFDHEGGTVVFDNSAGADAVHIAIFD